MWGTRHSVADWVCCKTQCAGDLEDSKSTSGGVLFFCKQNICPSQLDVQETNFCLAQLHRVGEILSLDAGSRLDGLRALDLWDKVIEVSRSTNNNAQPKHTSHQETGAVLDSKTKTQHVKRRQKVEQLSEVDHAPTNTHSSQGESQLYIF